MLTFALPVGVILAAPPAERSTFVFAPVTILSAPLPVVMSTVALVPASTTTLSPPSPSVISFVPVDSLETVATLPPSSLNVKLWSPVEVVTAFLPVVLLKSASVTSLGKSKVMLPLSFEVSPSSESAPVTVDASAVS